MKNIKTNRALSFLAIALVYLGASAIGIITYRALSLHFAISLLIADILATIFTFFFSLVFKNASVYDPYWSVQPPVILISFLIGGRMTLARWLILGAILLWGLRLTANWAYTFRDLAHQDWRYTMLREKTGSFYPVINFLGIHLVPTLVVYFCTLPAVYAAIYDAEANLIFFISIAFAYIAPIIQGIADIEMHKFRRLGHGGFIRSGLWKYSRHPNYLAEIIMWWAIGIAATSLFKGSLYLLTGAILNTLLFLFVSIPMAERRQAKKPGFSEYKSKTRYLFPIYKR